MGRTFQVFGSQAEVEITLLNRNYNNKLILSRIILNNDQLKF